MHYYQFNIGDYASHTRHLSLLEDLAYRRLLDAYYLAEHPLSGSATDVARLIGMRDQADAVEYVLKTFFEEVDGGWRNKRADAEIAHFLGKKQQASNAGKASAQRRLNGRSTVVDKSATDVQLTNNQEPITNTEEPSGSSLAAKRRKRIPPDFVPSDSGVELARQKGIALNDELQKFTDYHTARGSVMSDWQAAWRTWVSNAKTFARPQNQIQNRQEAIELRNKAAGEEWLRQEGVFA